MKSILIVLVLALTAVGCSNWNQDPLKDKDGVLGTGTGKPVELVQPKPLSTDAIRILAPDFLRFKENEEAEFSILVRNLLPGYTTQLVIDNMADFPGATFNAATGQFKWRPAAGAILPNEVEKYGAIKVRVIASQAGSATIFSEKEVQVVVNRIFKIPKMTSIQKLSPTMREGESLEVKVTIEDMDANPVDQKTWSNLQIMPTQGQKSISGFMSLKSYRWVNGSNYEAIFTIDLMGAEVSESMDTLSFDINLISRFYQISDRQTQSINVYTGFTDVKSTWTTILEDKLGAVINYQFLIYDPKAELKVSFEGIKNAIPNSTTKCVNATTAVLSCTFTFDTKVIAFPTVLSFAITTKSKNTNMTDAKEVLKDHNLTVNLVK